VNDIFEDDGEFFYYADNDDIVGPFPTYEQAEIASDAALRWQQKDHQTTIRKMKPDMGM
jgi:hypothetical protein